MAKYVIDGIFKGGNLRIEMENDKLDIGAFRKLVEVATTTYGGGYAIDGPEATPTTASPTVETKPAEEPPEAPDDDDDDLGLGDDDDDLAFSRKDVTSAAQDAITDSADDTKDARKKVAGIFKNLGGSTKLADINEGKYGKIIRTLKAGI